MTPTMVLKKYELYQRTVTSGLERLQRDATALMARLDEIGEGITAGIEQVKQDLHDDEHDDYGKWSDVVATLDSIGVPDMSGLSELVNSLNGATAEFDNAVANLADEIEAAKAAPEPEREAYDADADREEWEAQRVRGRR